MDLDLDAKCAVVGGASQGLGFAIAHRLAGEGAAVAMIARKREPLERAARAIAAETGARTVAIPADIRVAADCERIVRDAHERLGAIDILVNNDGAPPIGRLESFDDPAWHKAVEQNLMSVVRLSRAAVPLMRARGGGRIVNVTALSVLQPMPEFGLSVATWAGVIGYAKTLSLEVGGDGITVNTICPGRFATGRLARVYDPGSGQDELDHAALAKMAADLKVPVGRIGDPAEIAALVAFLCSSLAGYLTGHTLHLDGGRRANLL